jgi:hypothetical protein
MFGNPIEGCTGHLLWCDGEKMVTDRGARVIGAGETGPEGVHATLSVPTACDNR